MSQAEDLLNSLAESVVEHEHPVTDSDSYFIIDPDTRTITNTARVANIIMQNDHDSECYTFELQRYIEGHDMSLCNVVKIHYNNIDGTTGEEYADVADIYDLRVNPENAETVICSWLISRQAIQLAGNLSFLIQYQCVTDGVVTYEWKTDAYSDVEVRASRNNGPQAIIEYTDLIETWRAKLFGAGDSVIEDIGTASESEQARIIAEGDNQVARATAAGQEAQNALTAVKAIVAGNEAHTIYESDRKFGTAIVGKMSGKSMVAKDSSGNPFTGMKLFGKTTQKSTTGAQLANLPDLEDITGSGVTWGCKEGVVKVKGTSTASISSLPLKLYYDMEIKAGTYFVSGSTANIHVYMRIVQSDGTIKYPENTKFILDGTEQRATIYMQMNSGKTVDDIICPMLNAGTEALPWEPYTGGAPSPSVDYPQELESLGEWGNLFDESYIGEIFSGVSSTTDGITFTNKGKGVIHVSGTATNQANYYIKETNNWTLPTGTYTASVSSNKALLAIGTNSSDIGYANGTKITFTADSEVLTNGHFVLYVPSGTTIDEDVYLMLNYGTTALPYRPYSGEKEIGVDVLGKNLCGNIGDVRVQNTPNNASITQEGNIYKLSTSAYGEGFYFGHGFIKKGEAYTVSGNSVGHTNIRIYDINDTGTILGEVIVDSLGNFKLVFTAKTDNVGVRFWVVQGIECILTNLQIERGNTVTDYEPPRTPQSLITPVSSGLPGIPLGETIPDTIANSPVHMSGVWWDEDEGQYYIGDTVDYESGKYVQRVFEYEFTGNETINTFGHAETVALPIFYLEHTLMSDTPCMCNSLSSVTNYDILINTENTIACKQKGIVIHFEGGQGYLTDNFASANDLKSYVSEKLKEIVETGTLLKCSAILATPIETDLPESEIVAYQKLYTNYPTTTVFNDCDAMMEVGYVADTANYIDQNYVPLSKYTELEERITALENK